MRNKYIFLILFVLYSGALAAHPTDSGGVKESDTAQKSSTLLRDQRNEKHVLEKVKQVLASNSDQEPVIFFAKTDAQTVALIELVKEMSDHSKCKTDAGAVAIQFIQSTENLIGIGMAVYLVWCVCDRLHPAPA